LTKGKSADPGAAFSPAFGGGGSGSLPGGVVLGFGGLKDMFALNISGGDLGDHFTSTDGASGFGGFKCVVDSCRTWQLRLLCNSVPNCRRNRVVQDFPLGFILLQCVFPDIPILIFRHVRKDFISMK